MIRLIKSPFFKDAEARDKLINFIRTSNWFGFGPECEKFEKNFAAYQGRKDCVFMSNGSTANLALIQSLLNLGRLKKGDKVGFSAMTWSTNVMPIIQLGLVPVPIDVELDTLNISSKKILDVLKSQKLKAVFITNLLGFCGDMEKIKKLCVDKKVILLEDNCEALGSVYQGKKLGNFGLASTNSFYASHHMCTIEGGAICTDDKELALNLRIVRAHGWDRQLSKTDQAKIRKQYKVDDFYGKYTFYDLGNNFRPTEINAVLGNQELRYLDQTTKIRSKNFAKFAKNIYSQSNKYFPVKYDHMDFVSNFAVPIICRSKKILNEVVRKCAGVVEIRPIVGGDITRQPFFKKHVAYAQTKGNTNAMLIHEQGLYFANNPHLTKKEIETIISIFC